MLKTALSLLWSLLLLASVSQAKGHRAGSRLSDLLTNVPQQTHAFWWHRFQPVNRSVVAYTTSGRKYILKRSELITSEAIVYCEFAGYKDEWINFSKKTAHDGSLDNVFVPINKMRDVEDSIKKLELAEFKANNLNNYYSPPFFKKGDLDGLLLGGGIILLVAILILLGNLIGGSSPGSCSADNNHTSPPPVDYSSKQKYETFRTDRGTYIEGKRDYMGNMNGRDGAFYKRTGPYGPFKKM